MSHPADSPDRTDGDAGSAEELMDLLAPGTPAAAPARRPALPPPTAAAPPVVTGAGPTAGAGTMPGSGATMPLRVGSRFQPLPGPLPIATGNPATGSGLVLVAPAGTPVHAIESGTVTMPADPEEQLRVVAESGLTFCYGGLGPGSVAVSDGTRVAAGMILGTVAATKLSATPPAQPHLLLRIIDAAGADIDVPGFLVGLPDPNELGHAAVGTGVDVDPDGLDLEIARAAAEATPGLGRMP